MRLAGKVAIVTGSGRGIGQASALHFAKEGAKVTVAEIRRDFAEETMRLMQQSDLEAAFIPTDVTRESDVKRMVEDTVSRWGKVDILFNNAGRSLVKLVDETTEAEWDDIIAVNLKSVFFGVKYVVPFMRRQGGGVILNMGSISSFTGQMLTPIYVAAKGGVALFTKSLALDYAADNIRVNCLCPGITDTPAFRQHVSSSADPQALIRERQSRVPLGRFLTPDDIARAALYLVSDESDGITGIAHLVDGGMLAAAEYSSTWLPKRG